MSRYFRSTGIKKILSGIVLFQLGYSLQAAAQWSTIKGVHVGLIYPVSTNGTAAGTFTNLFSFNAIAGVSGAEKAFCLSGISSIIRHEANGFQLAGFSNHVGGEATGFQLAGFMNLVRNTVAGAQVAGWMNVSGNMDGFQLAGFVNLSGKQVKGLQVAGFINKTGDITGSQVAGFINIAGKVKGVQLAGFINIADSSDYPVGLINIIKNGEKGIGISTDETLTTLLSFRSGGKVLYGILGAGYNLRSSSSLYALEAGMGAHIAIAPALTINTEAALLTLSDFKPGYYFKHSLRVLPTLKAGRHLTIFVGPTFNYTVLTHDKGKKLVSRYLWSNTTRYHFHGAYIGAMGGIQVSL